MEMASGRGQSRGPRPLLLLLLLLLLLYVCCMDGMPVYVAATTTSNRPRLLLLLLLLLLYGWNAGLCCSYYNKQWTEAQCMITDLSQLEVSPEEAKPEQVRIQADL